MTISWYGHFCFKLATSATKPVTLLINPYGDYKELGLANVYLQKPDIVINYEGKGQGDFVIDSAGEYNVKSIDIYGAQDNKNKTYLINIDNIKCLYLGEMKEPVAPPFVGNGVKIDVLFVPIGGDYSLKGEKRKILDAEKAVKLVKEINPKIIIPMHFKTPSLKLKISDASGFLKFLNKKAEPIEKIIIKEKDLENKDKEVILLANN